MSNPPAKFYYNGQAYNSLEEMPEEARRILKDKNKNGLPDFLENLFGQNVAGMMNNSATFQKFIFKDKVFDKLEQLPPEEQVKIREKLEKLNQYFNNPNTPQENVSMMSASNPVSVSTSQGLSLDLQSMLGGAYSPVRGTSPKAFLVMAAIIGFLLLGVAGALAVFLLF